jgi:hypothetical protein
MVSETQQYHQPELFIEDQGKLLPSPEAVDPNSLPGRAYAMAEVAKQRAADNAAALETAYKEMWQNELPSDDNREMWSRDIPTARVRRIGRTVIPRATVKQQNRNERVHIARARSQRWSK